MPVNSNHVPFSVAQDHRENNVAAQTTSQRLFGTDIDTVLKQETVSNAQWEPAIVDGVVIYVVKSKTGMADSEKRAVEKRERKSIRRAKKNWLERMFQ